MSTPGIIITIWSLPHRGDGYIIEIDTSFLEYDETPTGTHQSLKGVQVHPRAPELSPDTDSRNFNVSVEQSNILALLTDQITYSFSEHSYTPRLDCPFYGLRVSRGYQEITVVWQGTYEDQDEPIRRLYDYVKSLAEA